ncbi:MAG: hypothetical protein EOP10_00930 [Proteobacteria bacterium]|nr:MAG: hypothetical protein EOP10_00930 [Pseudomonadota bacterium]
MPFEVGASQKDQTLPMVITLRGDEAIVEEFTYDSEQAMSFLGIKRSRLNQISGRELRVARVRRDRYIRPVYRESDLKDYLEWTRATATHLSSSKAIEQAVENLDDRFNDVLAVFNQKLDQVADEQRDFIRTEFESLNVSAPTPLPVEREDEQEKSLIHVGKVLLKHSARFEDVRSDLAKMSERLEAIHGTLNYFVPELKEISVGHKSLRFDVDQKFTQLSSMLLEITDLLGDLQQNQDEIALRLQSAIENVGEGEDLVNVKKPKRRRTRMRRGYNL